MSAARGDLMPPVRLWIFNHPFKGISDQIDFFCTAMRQHGYSTSVSNRPSAKHLNVLIENLSPEAAGRVSEFCSAYGKRIAVVMTEHIDFVDGTVRFHGSALGAQDDYMAPAVKTGRLFTLLAHIDHINCFLRLGDLPALQNFEQIAPGVPIHSIPFPRISPSDRRLRRAAGPPMHDLVFTGTLTEYRRKVLAQLSARYDVLASRHLVSRRIRDGLNAEGKLVLNIPQSAGWRWLSTMRILAALRSRRATIAVGDLEPSAISAACLVVHAEELAKMDLKGLLADYNGIFERQHADYEGFVCSPENYQFPHHAFDLWARLEL